LKRLVILVAVLLLILLVVGVLGWLCLRFLGPSVIEDNEGVWHIPGPGLEVLTAWGQLWPPAGLGSTNQQQAIRGCNAFF
jgi:hypothetical protein